MGFHPSGHYRIITKLHHTNSVGIQDTCQSNHEKVLDLLEGLNKG